MTSIRTITRNRTMCGPGTVEPAHDPGGVRLYGYALEDQSRCPTTSTSRAAAPRSRGEKGSTRWDRQSFGGTRGCATTSSASVNRSPGRVAWSGVFADIPSRGRVIHEPVFRVVSCPDRVPPSSPRARVSNTAPSPIGEGESRGEGGASVRQQCARVGQQSRHGQNSMRAPSSTTRSGGMLKKSGTELAWRAMRQNRRLRHRIMGAGPVGMSRMRPR
jgi:hypothetical protein